jgi:MFS transporter, DHA1 family, tetracycline resistance protein
VKRPLGILFLSVLVDLVGFGIVIPILPTYAKSYGASAPVIGLLSGTYSAMQLLFAPFWGKVTDRIGRRPVILIAAGGAMVAYFLFGIASSIPMLFVARALGGAFGASVFTAQAYIADVTPPEKRTHGMALIGAAFGLGFTLGPAIGGIGSHFLGARAPFFIAAGLAAFNLMWAALLLPEPPRHEEVKGRDLASFIDAFRDRTLAFWLGILFVFIFAFANIEATLALFAHARLDFDEAQNGYLFTYIGVVLTLVQGVWARRLAARLGEPQLTAAGMAILAVGASLVPLIDHGGIPVLVAAATGIAAGNALVSPAVHALISKATPAGRQGEMLGVAQSVSSLGRILGHPAGGVLFAFGVGHSLPYVAAAAILAIGATVAARGISRAAK